MPSQGLSGTTIVLILLVTVPSRSEGSAPTFPPALACPSGSKNCKATGSDCRQLPIDPDNCGVCGRVCDPWSTCVDGQCALGLDLGILASIEGGLGASPGGDSPPGRGVSPLLAGTLGARLRPIQLRARIFWQASEVRGSDYEELGLHGLVDVDLWTLPHLNGSRVLFGPLFGYRSRRLGRDLQELSRVTTFQDIVDLGGRLSFTVPVVAGAFVEPFVQSTAGFLINRSRREEPAGASAITLDLDQPLRAVWQLQAGVGLGFGIPLGRRQPAPVGPLRPRAYLYVVSRLTSTSGGGAAQETPEYLSRRRELRSLATLAPPDCSARPRCAGFMAKLEEVLLVLGYRVVSWRTLGSAHPLDRAISTKADAIVQVDTVELDVTLPRREFGERELSYHVANAAGEVYGPTQISEEDARAIGAIAERAAPRVDAQGVPGLRVALSVTDVSSGRVIWRLVQNRGLLRSPRTELHLLLEGREQATAGFDWSLRALPEVASPAGEHEAMMNALLEELLFDAVTLLRCSTKSDPHLPECAT